MESVAKNKNNDSNISESNVKARGKTLLVWQFGPPPQKPRFSACIRVLTTESKTSNYRNKRAAQFFFQNDWSNLCNEIERTRTQEDT